MRKRKPDLTKRQKEVLAILRSELLRHRYAPTMREIAAKAGLASTSSVKYQLDELEEKGYVRRDPRRPRTILLTEKGLEGTHRTTRGDYTNAGLPRGAREAEEEGAEESEALVADASPAHGDASPAHGGEAHVDQSVAVPLVGRIAAGAPILADQRIDEAFPLPRRLTGGGDLFMLEVSGDSMLEAAICDGDWVVVRRQRVAENGEIVAAMIDGEATVKVFRKEGGHVTLLPRNERYSPIPADDAEILGRVVAVLRSL